MRIETKDGNLWRDQVWVADFSVDNSGIPSLSNHINVTHNQYRYAFPRWSPDGSQIVVARSPYNSFVGTIWIINADGGNPRQLTDQLGDSHADWIGN